MVDSKIVVQLEGVYANGPRSTYMEPELERARRIVQMKADKCKALFESARKWLDY